MIIKHLYSQHSPEDILNAYINELLDSKKIENLTHANKLRAYLELTSDEKFLNELHDMFVETYRLLSKIDGFGFHMEGRQKSLISIEKKILRYLAIGKPLSLINDILAFRITLWDQTGNNDSVKFCYLIAEKIIEFFAKKGFNACEASPLIGIKEKEPTNEYGKNFKYSDVIKDYICYPKENGYQSIHIVFVDTFGNKFEIQIRTLEMNSLADDDDHQIYKNRVEKDIHMEEIDSSKINVPGYYDSQNDYVGIEKSKTLFPR